MLPQDATPDPARGGSCGSGNGDLVKGGAGGETVAGRELEIVEFL